MKITKLARNFIEEECRKPDSHYGYEPYVFHFVPMVKYALELANNLGADAEVVEIAAWLHDVGSIKMGRKNHHNTGATIAKKFLIDNGYDIKKSCLIVKCIKNHRSSTNRCCQSIEEKIISDADAISNFDNLAGIFKAAFVFEGQTQGEAAVTTRQKLQRKWNGLYLEQSKKIIKEKYRAAMLLLPKENIWENGNYPQSSKYMKR